LVVWIFGAVLLVWIAGALVSAVGQLVCCCELSVLFNFADCGVVGVAAVCFKLRLSLCGVVADVNAVFW